MHVPESIYIYKDLKTHLPLVLLQKPGKNLTTIRKLLHFPTTSAATPCNKKKIDFYSVLVLLLENCCENQLTIFSGFISLLALLHIHVTFTTTITDKPAADHTIYKDLGGKPHRRDNDETIYTYINCIHRLNNNKNDATRQRNNNSFKHKCDD